MANVVDKKEIKKNAVKILCERFYDNRTFGALLIHKKSKDEEELSDKSKKDKKNGKVEEADGKAINLGALTGPVQFSYAESINEIKVDVDCITRDCVTNEKDTEKERTMGRKPRINYGLYKFNVYITPYFARKTGFDSVDYELLKEALTNLFMFDKSACRAGMSVRGLWEFNHPNELGVAPDWKVTESVKVTSKKENPTCFEDFDISVENVPDKVKMTQVV
jgi:CRISPR-associated protein Csd2